MSSEMPLPRTAVPLGITDPVEKARAELKATLAAIEIKANLPKRASHAVEEQTARFRHFAHRNPTAAAVAVIGVAAAVGLAVWGAVRLYTR